MEETEYLTLPIEITFDLTEQKPETSGVMASLRDIGFQQLMIEKNGSKLKYKGQFIGTKEDLQEFTKKLKCDSTNP